MKKPKAVFCWSGGKDSAYYLHKVLSENTAKVVCLLTTVNDQFKRVSMHGTREELLDRQAASIGLPLVKVRVREGSNAEYEREMEQALLAFRREGVEQIIFGDIFLEDLREYRERNLMNVGLKGIFPLWKMDTRRLILNFIEQGFRTVICCTNSLWLGEEWLGREIDTAFLSTLPPEVDPCGENGEYHSFCYEGPVFKQKITLLKGEHVFRALDLNRKDEENHALPDTPPGFWFCDLL